MPYEMIGPTAKFRPAGWRCNEEPSQTVDKIVEVLALSFDDIILRRKLDYESEDMKEGIDTEKLAQWAKSLLSPFVQLDPRGGFINHEHMVEAVAKKIETVQYQAAFTAWAISPEVMKTTEQLVDKLSYTIRVMLAHGRIKKKTIRSSLNSRRKPVRNHIQQNFLTTTQNFSPASSRLKWNHTFLRGSSQSVSLRFDFKLEF